MIDDTNPEHGSLLKSVDEPADPTLRAMAADPNDGDGDGTDGTDGDGSDGDEDDGDDSDGTDGDSDGTDGAPI